MLPIFVFQRSFFCVAALCLLTILLPAQSGVVDGARALRDVEAVVKIGPRPSGSAQIEKTRVYIEKQVTAAGLRVERQSFQAKSPNGNLPLVNLIVKIPAASKGSAPGSGKRVLLTGHYDTKRFLDRTFVGANDGGSSTGLLLELVRVLAKNRPTLETWVVFFDGEEAVGEWTETDSVYGSRYLAADLHKKGELTKIAALINIDMIGDQDLNLVNEYFSDPSLRALAKSVAASIGKPKVFWGPDMPVEDDHVPFARRGVPTLNLIDFFYGPRNAYWHTDQDTMDKLSAESLATVGKLVLGILEKLPAK